MAISNFNLNPGIGPVPAAGAWLYSNYPGITGTLSNSSTAVTAINIGTSFLKVGMVVTGAGIVNNPPTTIAAIGSGTAITLSQNTTSSAAGSGVALNFSGIPGLQGTQFGNYGFFGVPDPTLTDVPGCAWAIPETQTLNPSATFLPAPGQGWISLAQGTTSGTTIQINLNPTPTWTTIFSGTTSGATVFTGIWTDGTNLRINLAGTVAASFTFYRQRYQPVY